jgi:hypothetical protein
MLSVVAVSSPVVHPAAATKPMIKTNAAHDFMIHTLLLLAL